MGEIEDHDREIDQSLAIVTGQNQEIDQPIRHEIDLDLGTDDPNHVTVHDPAPDREHEHTQEIRTIMLGMPSQNHDRNQLIRIEAQIEDHEKKRSDRTRSRSRSRSRDTRRRHSSDDDSKSRSKKEKKKKYKDDEGKNNKKNRKGRDQRGRRDSVGDDDDRRTKRKRDDDE